MRNKAYIAAPLVALVLWAPLIEGSETPVGWVVSRLLVLAIILMGLWRSADRESVDVPYHWTILAFVSLAALLAINTFRAPYGYPAIVWLINYVVIAGAMIAASQIRGQGEKWVIWALMGSAVFEALWGISENLAFLEPRSNGTFFNPNYFGGYLAAIAVFCAGRVVHSWSVKKWPEAAVAFLAIIGVVVSESRGAALALLVGLVAVGMVRWGSRVFPAIVVIMLLFLLVPNALMERIENLDETDIYAWSRFDMWKNTVAMIKDHPMGIGPGMYRFFSPPYAFPVDKAFARYGQVAETAHSAILDTAIELSPLFLIILLGVIGYLIYAGFRGGKTTDDETAVGAMGGLITILAQGAVDSMHKSPPSDFLAAIFAGMLLSRSLEGVRRISFKIPRRAKPLIALLGVAALWIVLSQFLGYGFSELSQRKIAQGDHNGAAKWLERAVKANPGDAGLWYQKGLKGAAFWAKSHDPNDYEDASLAFTVAMKLNPLNALYPGALAELILRKKPTNKKMQEAADLFRHAIAVQPFNPFYHVKLARLLIKMGDKAGGEKEFRRAIEIEPRFAAALVELADLLAAEGKKGEAALYYQNALTITAKPIPKPITAYVRAMVDIDKAEVEKALEKISAPDNPKKPE